MYGYVHVQPLVAGASQLTLGHLGDVGGQKTLRSYWRNYFEKTDALIWVVDATDRLRMDDCRIELHGLLQEEVRMFPPILHVDITEHTITETFWSEFVGVRE